MPAHDCPEDPFKDVNVIVDVIALRYRSSIMCATLISRCMGVCKENE
jgi:hypothetical protein